MWYKHKGQDYGISIDLIKTQKITFEGLCEIIKLQKLRIDFQQILIDAKDPILIKILFNQLTQIEFELQMAWGFPTDSSKHKSHRWAHCICPYHDNNDMPDGLRWVNLSCVLHGDIIKKVKLEKKKRKC
jgi:hypothetical protein